MCYISDQGHAREQYLGLMVLITTYIMTKTEMSATSADKVYRVTNVTKTDLVGATLS